MDPATLAIVAAGSSLASAGVGAMGQIQEGRAKAAAAGYNAKVAAINADVERQNAGFAGAEGESAVGTQGMKTRAQVGGTLASQGASGIDVNSKSSTDVRTSEAMLGKLDALQIRSNAARQVYGYQTGATSYENEAVLDRSQQKNDRRAGVINAATTVMGGVSQAALYSNFLTSTDPTSNLTGSADKYGSEYYS